MKCPRGHQWSSTIDGTTASSVDWTVCPRCGERAVDDPTSVACEDQLPPPPSSLATLVRPDSETQGEPPSAGLETPSSPEFPRQIGGFEILRVIGQGGMGRVYQARQLSLGRIVALKVLAEGAHAGPEAEARFRDEAEALARLSHPHIVHIYDVGRQDALSYLACEYVEGGTLADRLRDGPWTARDAASIMKTLAEAMAVVHRHGIIHRDLKPANILLTRDGTPKITDFGLVKALDRDTGRTQSGMILGTPCYMAPEQAQGRTGQSVGPAADVYALGAILFELLTGRPPFLASTTWETLKLVVEQPPAPPSRVGVGVPAALDAVCLKCLHKVPAKRYAECAELAADLQRFLEPSADPATPASRSRRRRGIVWWVVAASVAILMLGVGIRSLWHQRGTEVTPSPAAESQASSPNSDAGGPNVLALPQPDSPHWKVSESPDVTDTFDAVDFPSRNVGFLAGRRHVYKTVNAGATWQPLKAAPAGRIRALRFVDARTGWLGADRLSETRDGGESWSPVPLPGPPLAMIRAVGAAPAGFLLAGGTGAEGDLLLYQRAANQTAWTHLDPEATGCWGGANQPYRRFLLGDIAVIGPAEAVLVLFRGSDDDGVLLRTTDGGDTWHTVLTAPHDLYRIAFAGAKRGWLTGSQGTFWETGDGGATWTPQVLAAASARCLAAARGGTLGLATYWDGTVRMVSDRRAWLSAESVGLGSSMPGAVVVDDHCAYVLGADGRLARYEE